MDIVDIRIVVGQSKLSENEALGLHMEIVRLSLNLDLQHSASLYNF